MQKWQKKQQKNLCKNVPIKDIIIIIIQMFVPKSINKTIQKCIINA